MELMTKLRRVTKRKRFGVDRALLWVSKSTHESLNLMSVAQNTTMLELSDRYIAEGIKRDARIVAAAARTQREKEWAEKCLQS